MTHETNRDCIKELEISESLKFHVESQMMTIKGTTEKCPKHLKTTVNMGYLQCESRVKFLMHNLAELRKIDNDSAKNVKIGNINVNKNIRSQIDELNKTILKCCGPILEQIGTLTGAINKLVPSSTVSETELAGAVTGRALAILTLTHVFPETAKSFVDDSSETIFTEIKNARELHSETFETEINRIERSLTELVSVNNEKAFNFGKALDKRATGEPAGPAPAPENAHDVGKYTDSIFPL